MSKAEPRLVYDPRETGDYKQTLAAAGTEATLDFGFFGAMTELPEHQKVPVGDITFETDTMYNNGLLRVHNPVVIEVKTKEDLAGSMYSGRLLWQIWHMYLLKISGLVPGMAVLIRDISAPLYKDARASWKVARQALARWQKKYGFSVLLAEDPSDVVDVAKSFMREFWDPKAVAMPPPLLKKELLEWDLGIQAICMVPGWYIELASRLMSFRTFWEVAIDAHEMSEEAFCDNYKQYYGFGGKDNLRLKALWKAFNDIKLYKKVEFENCYRRKTPAELMKLAAEVREMSKKQ